MTDRILIDLAQDALVALLDVALTGVTATRDRALPQADEGQYDFLNVVLAGKPPEIQAECMGLAEDLVEVEYVQTYNLEWIVRRPDDAEREAVFGAGLRAIETAVLSDLTLGGIARGMTLGPPVFEVNPMVFSPATRACLVPVRVALRGVTLLS